MKPILSLATASLLLSAASAVAAPAPQSDGPRDVTRAQMMAEVNQVFQLADTDKDGFMSRKEFAARMTAILNRTPPGSPGAPTKEQAQKMIAAATAAFNDADTNHDGQLSRAEAARRPMAAFDAMDTNHDGIVTVAEKLAARNAAIGRAAPPTGR